MEGAVEETVDERERVGGNFGNEARSREDARIARLEGEVAALRCEVSVL